jgi:hypothetical protein
MHRCAPLALSVAAASVLAACASAPAAGHLRFHNQPPITLVNDRRDVPRKPAARRFLRNLNRFDMHFHRRLTRWMEMRPARRAASVNSMDEVPDSTWFTNRIGARDVTPDDIRRGPNVTGTPEEHLPLVIRSSKVGGSAIGFIVKDQRGVKYVLKPDGVQYPEVESAADVVAQRLLWACGYNVPEDYVVYLRREDLVLAPDSVVKGEMGGEKPMTRAFLDQQLDKVHVEPDGRIRALASQYLDGEPVGGAPPEGVRDDDPNDRIPHERRRELRSYAIYSWVDHTDMKEDNGLDMYVEDPSDKRVHYLVHYLVDFGNALGAQGFLARNRASEHAFAFDPGAMARSLFSLGLWRRRWEGREFPEHILGVGLFESQTFDPATWKLNTPNYRPVFSADRFDNFWGAKIMARFTPEHIRAAVEQGRYSDPRAVDYITRTLVERQRKAVRHWFDRVAPLDGFAIESADRVHRLCFADLALVHGVARGPSTATRYDFRAFDGEGRAFDWRQAAAGTDDGRACATAIPIARGADGYTIVRIDTVRGGRRLPGVLVHVARDLRAGAPRVIGLRRL